MAGRFPDGVGFVDLAPIRDPRQVVPAISRALGAPPAAGRPVLQALQDFLELRAALLVLDNFEHVLAAAPRLAEILTACPRLTLVVTSRAPCVCAGSTSCRCRRWRCPDPRRRPPAALARMPAVALFVERARAVAPASR